MRREIPKIILFVTGIIVLVNNFVRIPLGSAYSLSQLSTDLGSWVIIITAFAVGLATINLSRFHARNISQKREGWMDSVAMFGCMALFAIVGSIARLNPANVSMNTLNNNLFTSIITATSMAMFSMITFYIASASYRAFRIRSKEATVLLIAAVIMMIGRAPIGEVIWSRFPVLATWLLNVPNIAGQRAMMMGAAIGGFAAGLRVLLGIDKGQLGAE